MKLKNSLTALAAVSLAVAPAVAQAQQADRVSAPAQEASQIGEGGEGVILLILAGVAIIAGIIIAVDDDEDPVSA